jgi:hypothetical protein
MPLFDDLSMFSWGGLPWMNKVFCVIGAVAGTALGGWIGYGTGGVISAIIGAATGGFVGLGAGMLLSGILLYLFIFLVIVLIMFGWEWLMGLIGS